MATYSLIICGPCVKGLHEDCGGRKATLTINGEPFTGVCQCTKHSSIKPKAVKENDHEASSRT